jgi:Holliday junction resolvase
MKNEGQLTSQIKNYLVSKGCYVEKIFGGGYQASGIPDLIACYKGIFIAIEVKSPTGKGRASDIQKLKIRRIRECGGIAFITDSLEEVKRIFDIIDDGELINISYNDEYL